MCGTIICSGHNNGNSNPKVPWTNMLEFIYLMNDLNVMQNYQNFTASSPFSFFFGGGGGGCTNNHPMDYNHFTRIYTFTHFLIYLKSCRMACCMPSACFISLALQLPRCLWVGAAILTSGNNGKQTDTTTHSPLGTRARLAC